MSKELVKVRETLAPIVSKLSAEGASSREIVGAFRLAHASEIAAASQHLEDIALVKEIGSLRKNIKLPPSDYKSGADLFTRIGISPVLPIPGTDRNGLLKAINRKTPDLKRSQIIAYIRAHEPVKEKTDNDVSKLRLLFQRAEPFMKDDKITLSEALALAEAAEAKSREARAGLS